MISLIGFLGFLCVIVFLYFMYIFNLYGKMIKVTAVPKKMYLNYQGMLKVLWSNFQWLTFSLYKKACVYVIASLSCYLKEEIIPRKMLF